MKKSFISILLFLSMGIITDAFAQWIPTNGPMEGGFYFLYKQRNKLDSRR